MKPPDAAAQAEERTPHRRLWGLYLVLAAILIIVFRRFQVSTREFDWALFQQTLLGLHLGWFFAALSFSVLSYYCRALRWAAMMRPAKPDASSWRIFTATAMGFTAIVLLGSPAEVVRPYLISVRERVPLSSQIGIWLLERIYDFLAVLTLFAYGLIRIHVSAAQVGPTLGWVLRNGGLLVGALTTLCLVILFIIRQFTDTARTRIHDALDALPEQWRQKIVYTVDSFVQGVAATRDNRLLVETVVYTIFEWTLLMGTYYFLFHSFQTIRFSIVDVIILMGFLAFAGTVQLPGVGGGVQVASILVLTELFGTPVEVATGLSFFIWIASFVVMVPFGLFFAARLHISLARLRDIERIESEESPA